MRHGAINVRRRLGVVCAVVLVGAGAAVVVGAGPAGAAALAPTTTADGGAASGSLRDVIQNNANDAAGDTVTLASGATYTLTCAFGGNIEHTSGTNLTILTPAGQPPATIAMESGCQERLLQTGTESLTVNNIIFTGGRSTNGNSLTCDDDTDGGAVCADGPVTIINSSFVDNATSDDGGAIKAHASLTVVGSTFSGNCAPSEGGIAEVLGTASFTNSTVTNNTTQSSSAIDMENSPLTLVYSDFVGNIFDPATDCGGLGVASVGPKTGPGEGDVRAAAAASEPSNLDTDDTGLVAFASVVALPKVGPSVSDTPVNCDASVPTTSNGFNFSDDATCLFTNTATGDRENAGDPGLGALANNGGFTQTLLPGATSPLLNFVPLSACQADGAAGVTTDQRGVSRPQATGCEVGAVEVLAVALVARFTG